MTNEQIEALVTLIVKTTIKELADGLEHRAGDESNVATVNALRAVASVCASISNEKDG